MCVRLETQQMAAIMVTDSPESIDVALTSLQPLKGCDSMQGLYVSFPVFSWAENADCLQILH